MQQNAFAARFYAAFLKLIEEKRLAKSEIKAVLKILEYMQGGLLLRLSFASLARDAGLDPANISKVIASLKEKGLIVEEDGNLFLNPDILDR